jgi:Ca2+-transporting ATPase
MLTDVVPALALATEPAEPKVMERPPRDPAAPLFGGGDYPRLGRASLGMAATSLGAFALGAIRRSRGARPPAMAFTALAAAQLLHTRACRNRAGPGNPLLSGALAGAAALQVAALSMRPLRRALSIGATSGADLALAALIGAAPAALRWARGAGPRDEIVVGPRTTDAKKTPAGPSRSAAPCQESPP